MAKVTSKVVVKMNKLEGKLDQQVAVVKRQLESFRVHYLEGQKVGSQHEQQNDSKIRRIRNEAENFRSTSVLGECI
jgi:hypothetical protein